ncbi:hypothetical protein SAMD00019534_071430 [Acytostelium subglobosum LB1]|uniref:hypothetical protein n=1 Tax=Acytostelium subglobosum LB1 TaxID=1410327 RepID=UPI0006449160|nr:hypothetical protein SAMD00019534_071430 [Acytostelium subglobosum LB1]GAM23968.1 hypothetical protein SAMD00019534_071430 [Acytostelium subglobosum LB1]|eukprot:XP_012753004.1 hypothetical protein SAMD00019534_071430 [Acytostelium subglobosum LB1]
MYKVVNLRSFSFKSTSTSNPRLAPSLIDHTWNDPNQILVHAHKMLLYSLGSNVVPGEVHPHITSLVLPLHESFTAISSMPNVREVLIDDEINSQSHEKWDIKMENLQRFYSRNEDGIAQMPYTLTINTYDLSIVSELLPKCSAPITSISIRLNFIDKLILFEVTGTLRSQLDALKSYLNKPIFSNVQSISITVVNNPLNESYHQLGHSIDEVRIN